MASIHCSKLSGNIISLHITTEGVLADKALSLVVFIQIDPTNKKNEPKKKKKKNRKKTPQNKEINKSSEIKLTYCLGYKINALIS